MDDIRRSFAHARLERLCIHSGLGLAGDRIMHAFMLGSMHVTEIKYIWAGIYNMLRCHHLYKTLGWGHCPKKHTNKSRQFHHIDGNTCVLYP